VLLDNCEHVLEPCREIALALLRNCDEVTVMATSREPLGLGGETTWRVPSLTLPSRRGSATAHLLEASDAARLFVERARQTRPSFEITDATAPGVAEICADLDGIPLAIELAAARVRMMSIERIATGLADRFHLLTGGARDVLPRLQTLLASVEWSHDLLTADERALLRRCGVFHGGFTLEACEAVCASDDIEHFLVLDLLTSLVDKSLIQVDERASTTRYVMLETIRQFALERLDEVGETRAYRDRHAEAFLAVAESATPTLGTHIESEDRLAEDSANLSAAIDHAAGVNPDMALRLCIALAYWWLLTGQLVEGVSVLTLVLDASTKQSQLRGSALFWRGYLAFLASDYALAKADSMEALPLVRESGDLTNEARVLNTIGLLETLSDPQTALSSLKRACELAREADDDWCLAEATQNLGWARLLMGDYDEARVHLEASVAIARRFGWRELEAWHWWMLGHAVYPSGDRAAVQVMWERSLASASDVQLGPVTWSLSLLDVDAGDGNAAIERLTKTRELVVAAGTGVGLQFIDAGIGLAQAARGDLETARESLTAAALEHSDGYSWTRSMTLVELAKVELLRGDEAAASTHAEHALDLAHRLGNDTMAARARRVLARVALARQEWGNAEQLAHAALRAHVQRSEVIEVPETLDVLAEVAIALESDLEAARLMAASNQARANVGPVRWTPEQKRVDTLTERLQARLGLPQVEAALANGAATALEEMIAYVQRARGERRRPSSGWESLTPTELQIVRHAAAGLTNPEIAERMFIARGTVKVHLSHIYTKLGVRNRSEVAAEAVRHGLTEEV
jgi:predicted ATPase/DNA-binding CsgD family transcriptional regulator